MLLHSAAMVAKKLLVLQDNSLCQTNISPGCYT